MQRIGFIGLGVMGESMAGHLLRYFGGLHVWNRTTSKTEKLASEGATVEGSVQDLAKKCNVIILCVGTSEDVKSVVEQIAQTANPETLIIDHSTIEPAMAAYLGDFLETKRLRFVDAPVTGGSIGAATGQLTIFCGGSEADVAQAIEVIRPYSKRAERVGECASGQKMKLANQIAVGGALLGLCESLAFAKKAGLDLVQAHQMIGGGSGGSWAFEFYGPKVLSKDWKPGFSVKNQQKDFRYCIAAARELSARVPMTALAHQLLSELEAADRAGDTTAAIFDVFLMDAVANTEVAHEAVD